MAWVTVCGVGDVESGGMRRFPVGGVEVAVYHLDDGFHATAAICTHERADLTRGELRAGRVSCPLHGARFDVRTGRVLSPPAFKPLKVYPVQVAAGEVQVDLG